MNSGDRGTDIFSQSRHPCWGSAGPSYRLVKETINRDHTMLTAIMGLTINFHRRCTDDDVQCLRELRRGDRSALLALYRRYQPEVARFIGVLTGCEQRTAKLVTDTFLAAWQQAPVSSNVACVRTWILSIACGVALQSLEGEGTFAATQVAPVREAAQGGVPLRFAGGIACLPPKPRAALVLAYGLGCSASEIAAIMTCPVDEVNERIASARSVLHVPRDADSRPFHEPM